MYSRFMTKPKMYASVVLHHLKKAKSKNKVITSSIIGLICFVNRDLYNTVALCDENQNSSGDSSSNSKSDSNDAHDKVKSIMNAFQKYVPEHINELSVSSVLGICTGIAFKRVGRIVATAIGSIFVVVQTLQHYNYIDINFKQINDKAIEMLDTDGDGKLTVKDVHIYVNQLINICSKNMPSAAAFSSGLSIGLFWG